jgi:hypothetical protein
MRTDPIAFVKTNIDYHTGSGSCCYSFKIPGFFSPFLPSDHCLQNLIPPRLERSKCNHWGVSVGAGVKKQLQTTSKNQSQFKSLYQFINQLLSPSDFQPSFARKKVHFPRTSRMNQMKIENIDS